MPLLLPPSSRAYVKGRWHCTRFPIEQKDARNNINNSLYTCTALICLALFHFCVRQSLEGYTPSNSINVIQTRRRWETSRFQKDENRKKNKMRSSSLTMACGKGSSVAAAKMFVLGVLSSETRCALASNVVVVVCQQWQLPKECSD